MGPWSVGMAGVLFANQASPICLQCWGPNQLDRQLSTISYHLTRTMLSTPFNPSTLRTILD